jgi:GAF domain-containing protein
LGSGRLLYGIFIGRREHELDHQRREEEGAEMTIERFADESQKLRDATDRLDEAGTIEEIAGILRDCGRGAIGADGIALILRDGDFCHYFEEEAIGPLWRGQKFPMGACISGWAMLNRKTVCIPDIRIDKRIPYDLYENTFVRSLVMAPVEKNPPVGAFGAYWSWAHVASAQQVAAVEALAEAAGAAILRVRQLRAEQKTGRDNQPINHVPPS